MRNSNTSDAYRLKYNVYAHVAIFQKELSHRTYRVSSPSWQISVLERVTLNYEWLGLAVYVGGPRCPEFTHCTMAK